MWAGGGGGGEGGGKGRGREVKINRAVKRPFHNKVLRMILSLRLSSQLAFFINL